MSEWKGFELKELTTKIGSGATPRGGQEAYKTDGISLIRSQNILDFSFSYSGLAFIDEDQADALKNVIIGEDDVLINITGDSVARVAKVPKDILPARVNQHVAILRPNKEKLDSDYLLYYLLNPVLKKHLLRIASDGATRNALTKSDLEELVIVAPDDVNEQKEVVQLLSKYDKKIALLRQQNQDLEELAQTLFKRWFVEFEFPNENGEPYKSSGGKMVESELGEIPEGWRLGRFDELIEFSNGYAFLSNELLDEPTQTTMDVFKMGHIMKGGGFNPSKSKSFIEKENCQGLEKYILKKGDLLMCMTDMKDNTSLLGHTALMSVDDKFIVNQRVGLIRAKNEVEMHYPYLYILTNSKAFLSEIRSRANSGVQVNLSTNGIKETETIIATKEVNESFDKIANRLFEKILTNQEEIQTLTQLRDTLLPKLVSGELRINKLNFDEN